MNNIPLVDLKAQYKTIEKEVNQAIKQVLISTHFILGEEVAQFEKEFAKFTSAKYAVGVASGLSGLELGMKALGIGKGGEVITPANSFIASSSAISFTGATPVLVDADEKTYNIDPKKIEEKINKNTKAIMVVHLYGQPAEMDPVKKIAKKFNLSIIEDACQAHGARYKNLTVGSIGKFAAFSFYPGKNLGAYGDGGIITTSSKTLANKLSMMRNYGQKKKYHHHSLAWNSRLDTLQAAVLLTKLKHLNKWNQKRKLLANYYTKLLIDTPVITPYQSPDSTHVFHLYVIQAPKRDKLSEFLNKNGVSTGLHYPIPIHLQKACKNLGHKRGDFPISEKLSTTLLSLPIYPEMEIKSVEYITGLIKKFYKIT